MFKMDLSCSSGSIATTTRTSSSLSYEQTGAFDGLLAIPYVLKQKSRLGKSEEYRILQLFPESEECHASPIGHGSLTSKYQP